MALDAVSKVLHYWTSRGGHAMPIVGGDPHHARSSIAKFVDRPGLVRDAVINTPRFEWASVSSEERAVLRLEQARTNLAYYSEAANTEFSPRSGSFSANAALAPDGTLTADKFTPADVTSYAGGHTLGVNVNGRTFAVSCWLRADAPTTVNIGLLQSGDNGCGVAVACSVTKEWQRFSVVGTGNAVTTSFYPYVQSNNSMTPFYIWGFQIEEAASVSSYVPAPSNATVARAAESFYWDHYHVPQATAIYCRFVERGTKALAATTGLVTIGSGAPRVMIYNDGGGGYRTNYHNGVGAIESGASTPATGDVVEYAFTLTGAGVLTTYYRTNGGAVAEAAVGTLALPTAWGATKIELNGIAGASFGLNDFAELKAVKQGDLAAGTAEGIMAELAAFEMNEAREIIATGS